MIAEASKAPTSKTNYEEKWLTEYKARKALAAKAMETRNKRVADEKTRWSPEYLEIEKIKKISTLPEDPNKSTPV
jgi:hypothetical protein